MAPPSAAGSAPLATPPSSAPGDAALTKAAFCERAVKIGEANLAKCDKEDKNQSTYLRFEPEVGSAKKDCEERVGAPNVEFHADAAAKCLAAAEKRGGATVFSAFYEIEECRGVLSGKAQQGQAAKFLEECARGLSLLGGKCEKPVAANADCSDARNILGKYEDHPECEPGHVCTYAGTWADGNVPPTRCLKGAVGERCSAEVGNCPRGSSCYQGRCREFADVGADCMQANDCKAGTTCDIKGGAFGKCAPLKATGESCKDHWNCTSRHCRSGKCTSFCGSG